MSLAPRWYCPPGVDRPPHAIVPGVLDCLPECGPDGAMPGGRVYGGTFDPGEPGWRQHSRGWWYNLHDADPRILIRLAVHPRIVSWREVVGARPEHLWRVPVLLKPTRADSGDIESFAPHVDAVWNGTRWDLPPDIVEAQRRVLLVNHRLGIKAITIASPEAVEAAIAILGIGHEFDREEIIEAGWITSVLVIRTLLAVVDLEPGL